MTSPAPAPGPGRAPGGGWQTGWGVRMEIDERVREAHLSHFCPGGASFPVTDSRPIGLGPGQAAPAQALSGTPGTGRREPLRPLRPADHGRPGRPAAGQRRLGARELPGLTRPAVIPPHGSPGYPFARGSGTRPESIS